MIASIAKSIYDCTGHKVPNLKNKKTRNVEQQERDLLRKRARELHKQVGRQSSNHSDYAVNISKGRYVSPSNSPSHKISKGDLETPPRAAFDSETANFDQAASASCWATTESNTIIERLECKEKFVKVIKKLSKVVSSSIPQRLGSSSANKDDSNSSSTDSEGHTFYDELQKSYTFDNFIYDDEDEDISEKKGALPEDRELKQVLSLRKSAFSSTDISESHKQQLIRHTEYPLEFRGHDDVFFMTESSGTNEKNIAGLKETDKTYSSDSTFTGLWNNQSVMDNQIAVDVDGFPLKTIHPVSPTQKMLLSDRSVTSTVARFSKSFSFGEDQSILSKGRSCRSRSTIGSELVGQSFISNSQVGQSFISNSQQSNNNSLCFSEDPSNYSAHFPQQYHLET
eukprot:CAMPEP_0194291490 /NCGR_PEP_ID=MMETSP0169-20130528/43480_1 /TAXON_ID=218684 /ORGANISM="Corethron pennatum, Strain L29A3" /LENGTH=396 /DNA_ID=CAMNT_0039039387 /DNA_START=128 /DNA_END=1318 /DNA_ORIENTATION=+